MTSVDEMGRIRTAVYIVPGQIPRMAAACYKVGIKALDSGRTFWIESFVYT